MLKRNIIVIGASAGGVQALCELFKQLPKQLDATIFVVMHIGSKSILSQILSGCGALRAVEAEHHKNYKSGCIYVAPANHHLSIKEGKMVLSRGPRENGHRPAIDVLFRSAARENRKNVVGLVLSGGQDDGTAGLYAIKARGGVAIVQDPAEAVVPDMPRSAREMVDIDFCLPIANIGEVLVQLANGEANIAESPNGESKMQDGTDVEHPNEEPPGNQVPLTCPECSGPIYEVKEGKLARFQCLVGHAFSPQSLSEQHADALERALWTAMRTLKERTVLLGKLTEKERNKGEEELRARLEDSTARAESDLKLLREILSRI
jgi:two-component system, chemotaxis family, protein-glutamate methylesterase/glutaminase